MNIYNFDPKHEWKTVKHYEDNSVVSNGSWEDVTINKFVTAGNMIKPPGFDPEVALDSVVTFCNANFQVSRFSFFFLSSIHTMTWHRTIVRSYKVSVKALC